MTHIRPIIPAAKPGEVDRLAEAVNEVQQMHREWSAALANVETLKAELHREQDRVTLLQEAHDRWRAEALIFRTKLIELSTQMSAIGLLTVQAQDVIKSVNELNHAQDTPNSEALDKFEEQLRLIVKNDTKPAA